MNQSFPIKEINRPDQTEAEICQIELLSVDPYGREADVKIKASDSDGYIQYYCYRFDQGEYSELYPWPRENWDSSLPEHEFTVALPEEETADLQVYNGYDLKTESNTITIFIPLQEEETEEITSETETLSRIPLDLSMSASEIRAEKGSLILLILCVSLILTGSLYFVIRLLQKRKRRNKGHKEW